MDNSKILKLEAKIDIKFKNKDLLATALTHRSYLNENPKLKIEHNERLEFLGDAVLELVVTEYLYKNYPNPEGELTNWRAALVNSSMLSQIASKIGLNDFIFLSKGESKDTGRARQYILANAIEALIGAIYLDGGYEKSKEFIEKFILTELPTILKNQLYRDSKSLFQEKSQEVFGATPVYRVLKEWGPDHSKSFQVGVFLGNELAGTGDGQSKQEAQQKAAQEALKNKGW